MFSKLLTHKNKLKPQRRRFKRFNISRKLRFFQPGFISSSDAHATNLSRTGVLIRADKKIIDKKTIFLSFSDPVTHCYKNQIRGEVVWVTKTTGDERAVAHQYEAGVKITNGRLFGFLKADDI